MPEIIQNFAPKDVQIIIAYPRIARFLDYLRERPGLLGRHLLRSNIVRAQQVSHLLGYRPIVYLVFLMVMVLRRLDGMGIREEFPSPPPMSRAAKHGPPTNVLADQRAVFTGEASVGR